MEKKGWRFPFWFTLFVIFAIWSLAAGDVIGELPRFGPLVTKESRRTIAHTDSGVITAVDVHDGYRSPYHLQFITLEPSSLFLPVLLHTDMVFYVQTGRGTVSWVDEDETNHLDVGPGDIYRLEEGTVFYVQSHLDPTRQKLRIHSIFNTMITSENAPAIFVGPYSNVSDLVLGFDEKSLQMGFQVSEEVIQGIKWTERPPPIVHFAPNGTKERRSWKEGIIEAVVGVSPEDEALGNKKKRKKSKTTKTFNLLKEKPDVENCNGRSIAVTSKDFKPLKGSDIGVFMVNLTKGSMMGPHWNPRASEMAIVLHGQGVVQVVCPSKQPSSDYTYDCENSKFRVKEGDLFVVPRYHPMAQVSFNDDSFVFVGFSTNARRNHPQFLAGKKSVLQVLDREILALSFNAPRATIDALLSAQGEEIMLECTSCAEEAVRKMEEETERRRREEERKREEEEAKRREEEARRREQEEVERRREEEAKQREEEEERRREEEEERKREEEAKQREEEEERRREEEEERKREEEAKQREVEERRREEEEGRREEEAKQREGEEKGRREEEEEERRREEEGKQREGEEKGRREEEEEERRREEDEEAKRREEGEEQEREREEDRRKKEEEGKRQEEEEREREMEEEARRHEEEERERQEQSVMLGRKVQYWNKMI